MVSLVFTRLRIGDPNTRLTCTTKTPSTVRLIPDQNRKQIKQAIVPVLFVDSVVVSNKTKNQ